MMQELSFRIAGVSPLLMHNGRLVNPADEYARKMKEVSSKRKKTDADYEEMGRLEWFGEAMFRWAGSGVARVYMAGCKGGTCINCAALIFC